jgi:glutathione S-transferase
MDNHLANKEWQAEDYSIADIANWCWVRTYKWPDVAIDGLNNLDRWLTAMQEKPGMAKGIEVPFSLGNLLDDEDEQEKFKAKAREMLQK